jgi:hypothetical protein
MKSSVILCSMFISCSIYSIPFVFLSLPS